MRGKIELWLAAILIASTLMVNIGFADTMPTVYIDPAVSPTNPGEEFTIAVSISDAVGVGAWEFSMTWDRSLTEFPPEVTEGTFLSSVGPTWFQYVPDSLLGKIGVGCFLFSGSASGDGVLAYVTFKVTASGSSVIDLFDTKLFDASVNPIDHNVEDGAFDTTYPYVDFTWFAPSVTTEITDEILYEGKATQSAGTEYILANDYVADGSVNAYLNGTELAEGVEYSVDYKIDFAYKAKVTLLDDIDATDFGGLSGEPFNVTADYSVMATNPLPGDLVTFDGSACYDPDGGDIVSYEWDFGDGDTATTSDPIVTHTYADYRLEPYHVTLTCTDDEAEMWSVTKDLPIWRDLGIFSVWTSMDEWDTTHFSSYRTFIDPYEDLPGLMWVLVTVVNLGTQTETYTVTVYADADTTVIGDEFELYPGLMTKTLGAGGGTGFSLWYLLDISYGASSTVGWEYEDKGVNDPVPTGQYTITAVIECDGDQDPSNDILQSEFGVHGSVEMTKVLRASAGRVDHVYKLKHGPITFGGNIQNFDFVTDIFRVEQGEWGRISFDIYDEAGTLVATLKTDAVYLEYMEESGQLKATWAELALGTYDAIAYAEFGTDGETFPHWGGNTYTFSFSII